MLRARAITYLYGPEAPGVVEADIEVAAGETLAIVGPNGAGKSTLLKLLEGRLSPLRCEVDAPARRTEAGRVAFGYAAESNAHFESLSGRYNAVFFARAGGVPRAAAHTAVSELMHALGLIHDADRPVAEYSFGARRKLTLVEALTHSPRVLLLDEPTVGLDAESKEALAGLLRGRAEQGFATILASHDLPFVVDAVDRVLFMHRGRVLEGGRPSDLLSDVGDVVRFAFTLAEPLADPPEWPDGIRLLVWGNPVVVEAERGEVALPEAIRALISRGARLRAVVVREAGLAEAFRRIAGEELGVGARIKGARTS